MTVFKPYSVSFGFELAMVMGGGPRLVRARRDNLSGELVTDDGTSTAVDIALLPDEEAAVAEIVGAAWNRAREKINGATQ